MHSVGLTSAGSFWMEPAVVLSSKLLASLRDGSWPIAHSHEMAKSTVLTSLCSSHHPRLFVLLHGGLRGCQQLLCVCRLELLLPHCESWFRENVSPTACFYFFTKVSPFALPVRFKSSFRSFPSSSLPCFGVFQCLDSKSQRDSFSAAYPFAIFLGALFHFL